MILGLRIRSSNDYKEIFDQTREKAAINGRPSFSSEVTASAQPQGIITQQESRSSLANPWVSGTSIELDFSS